MAKKSSNHNNKIFLILTIVFFVLGIILIGINIFEYVQQNSISEVDVEEDVLSSGGIVSITIVEPPENQLSDNVFK